MRRRPTAQRLLTVAFAASLVLLAFSLAGGGIGLLRPNEGFGTSWDGDRHALYFDSVDGVFCVIWSSGWPDRSWPGISQLAGKRNPLVVHNLIVFELTEESQLLTTDGTKQATVRWYGLRSNIL